jgi:excisionase family DNA binding protein
MPDQLKPLYVRLPASDADRLDEVAAMTGRSKRELVGDAVREHLSTDDGLTVGRVAFREPPAEVLTLGEAAALLRVEEYVLAESAERGEIPGRRLGQEWRFRRDALLEWLAMGIA